MCFATEYSPPRAVIDFDRNGSSLTTFGMFEELKVFATNPSKKAAPVVPEPKKVVSSPSAKNIVPQKQTSTVNLQPSTPAKHVDESNNSALNSMKELEMLAELKIKGIITKEEFDAKKKKILGL